MRQSEFIKEMDRKIRLVRVEFGLTQEQASKVLGISRKTLVEIEMGRRSLGWTGAVAVAAIFSKSEILASTFGGECQELISAIAFEHSEIPYPKTMGGKVWWKTVEENDKYKIQQNIISNHYRILDSENYRICSSFNLNIIEECAKKFFE